MGDVKEKLVDQLYSWYTPLDKNNLILLFKGDFNQDLLNAILSITSGGKLYFGSENAIIKNRMFGVIVECLQNICKHGESYQNELVPGIILIGRSEEDYIVSTGNIILKENVAALKSKIDKISELDPEKLRKYHNEVLINTKLSKKSGAGLGLINIARKSNKKLGYNFKELDGKHSFYSIEVKISDK